MIEKQLDDLLARLAAAHGRKTDRLLLKANAEIAAIQREDAAYYDGVYDAIKEIRLILEQDGGADDGKRD